MKAYLFQHEMQSNARSFGRKDDINVTFSGDKPFVKGKQINLPSLPLTADLNDAQVKVLRGFVDKEAGRIRHTDTKRALDFDDRARANKREPLANIADTLMDQWVSSKVMDEYYGSRANLEASHKLRMDYVAEKIKKVPDKAVETFDKEAIPTLLDAGAELFARGPESDKEVTRVFSDNLLDHAAKWREELQKCETTEDVLTLAKSIYKLINEDPKAESDPEDFDPESGQDFKEGDPKQEGEDSKEGDSGHGDRFAELNPKGQGKGGKDADSMLQKEKAPIENPCDNPLGGGGIGDMVGNYHGNYRVFTTEHDVTYRRKGTSRKGAFYGVYQSLVEDTDASAYIERKGKIKSSTLVMKNKLRRALIAKINRSWERGKEDGILDSSRLVRAWQGDPQVFKVREERDEHETAITLLIDLSGSMSGTKASVATDVAIAFSECFEGTQMRYKIVGFHNSGGVRTYGHGQGKFHRYEALQTLVFKDFDEQLRTVRGSVGKINHGVGGNNSDFDFVANELAELNRRPEKRKVLFVLSDGHPACYSDASMDSHVKHIRNIIKEHERKGVECVGIGICDSAVKEIYTKNVVVNNVEELANKVFNQLTELLVK